MRLGHITTLVRNADKRWQRWKHPEVRHVLVNARIPMNYACIAPVHNAMRSDHRVKFYFISTKDPLRVTEIYKEAGEQIQIISPQITSLMRFDAYLSADFLWKTLPRGTHRIQMFHGVAGPRGYEVPAPGRRTWNRYFFINEQRMRNYIAAGVKSSAARLIGMPKVDCLVDGSLKRDSILVSLGIDPSRKTVLYAPTWSVYSSLNSMGEELVRGLVAAGYAVIIKLHDWSLDAQSYRHSGAIDWLQRLKPIISDGNGYLATSSNSSPYLAAADVMVTDHSSIGFEFTLLDRPLIRIEMPELIKHAQIHPELVELLAEAASTINKVEEVISAIEKGLGDPLHKSDSRQAVAQKIYFKAGTATKRAVSEIYNVIELEEPEKTL